MGFLSNILGAVGGIAGSAIPGIGNVAGGAIGSGLGSFGDTLITDKMSDSNDKAAREWQEKMYDKQFGNNKALWYEQQEYLNAYNDPSAQVDRLRKAGINPALALGAMNTGNAQGGSTGASSVPGSSPSSRPSLGDVTTTLEQLVNGQNTADIQKEDLRGRQLDNEAKEIDNLTRFTENFLRLQDIMAGIGEKKASTSRTWTDNAIAQLMAAPAYKQAIQNLLNSITQNDLMVSETMLNWQEFRLMPAKVQMEYETWVIDLANKYRDGEIKEQQLQSEIERTNHIRFQAEGQKFQNELNKKTESFVIELSKENANIAKENADFLKESKDARIEAEIQKTLPEDKRYPFGTQKLKNQRRTYGDYPDRSEFKFWK